MADVRPSRFVCAMPMELKPLAKRLGLRPPSSAAAPARTGTLDGRPVVAIVTGMGTRLAAAGVRRLLDAVTPARVVVVGITGAVDDETPIGAVILPERVIDHASGREHEHHLLGPATGHGALWTTDVITPAAELPALRARGVVALDMETAAIAQACERRACRGRCSGPSATGRPTGPSTTRCSTSATRTAPPNPGRSPATSCATPARIPGLAAAGRDARLAARPGGRRRRRRRAPPADGVVPPRDRSGRRRGVVEHLGDHAVLGLGGRALPGDRAVVEQHHPVAQRQGVGDVLLDDQQRRALPPQAGQLRRSRPR